MPAAFRASSNGNSQDMGVGATLTMARPAGTQAGDLLVAMIVQDRDASVKTGIPAPSGWTQIDNTNGVTAAQGVIAIYTYTATAGDPASWGWLNGSGGQPDTHGAIVAIAGTDGTLVSGPTWQHSTTAGTAYTAPSVTGVAGGLLVVGLFRTDSRGNSGSFTMPAPLVEREDLNVGSSYTGLGVGTQELTSNGATGTRSATHSDSSRWSTVSLVVAPAAAGGSNVEAAANDTAGVSDSVSAARTAARTANPSDSGGVSDGIGANRGVSRQIGDNSAISDTVSTSRTTDRGAADPAGVSDAATVERGQARIAADPVGIGDQATAAAGVGRLATDTAGIGDAATSQSVYTRSGTDPGGIGDTVGTTADVDRSVSDALGVSDDVAADLEAGAVDTIEDVVDVGLVVSDDVEATLSGPGSYELDDTAGIGDDVTTDLIRDVVVDLEDDVGILDTVTREGGVFDYVAEVGDDVGITDEIAVLEKSIGVEDQFPVFDEVDTAWFTSPVIADAAGISDDIETGRGSPATPADSVGLEDQTTVTSTRAVHAADTVSVEDTALAEWLIGGSADLGPDTVGVADTVRATRARTLTLEDTVLAIDTFTSLDPDQVIDGRILYRRAAARVLVRWQARALPPRIVARLAGRRWGVGGQLARRAFAHIIGRRFGARIKED